MNEKTADEAANRILITVDEAARRLAIGRSHIYDQMQRGVLRSVHLGRSRRILVSDLEAFVEQLLEGHVDVARLRGKTSVKRLLLRSGRR